MEQVALEYCKRETAHLHDAEKQELDCARLVAKGLPCEVETSTLIQTESRWTITKGSSRLIRHKNK
jgi:hypothetical protein